MIEEATSSKHSGTTDAPLVSVVAPCFNAEKYLEEALRSIYEQDYPNFEVIIVDDGSTDNSYAMLEQLQKVHGFQLYRQQNQGVSAALNFGLQHARGDYVATPDLDDIMLPHSLSVRAAYLDQHPEVGCVGALVIYIDSEGQETKRQNGNRIRQLDFDYLLGNAYVCGAPVSLYRMEALRAAGFYDPEIKVQDPCASPARATRSTSCRCWSPATGATPTTCRGATRCCSMPTCAPSRPTSRIPPTSAAARSWSTKP